MFRPKSKDPHRRERKFREAIKIIPGYFNYQSLIPFLQLSPGSPPQSVPSQLIFSLQREPRAAVRPLVHGQIAGHVSGAEHWEQAG